MAIYKNRWFKKWAKKAGLKDKSLCKAVKEMRQGNFDADLGGGLFKKRVAREGGGKSGGFRTLVATNKADRWFFVFGFEKSERENIDQHEEKWLKKLAGDLLTRNTEQIANMQASGELTEVHCDD